MTVHHCRVHYSKTYRSTDADGQPIRQLMLDLGDCPARGKCRLIVGDQWAKEWMVRNNLHRTVFDSRAALNAAVDAALAVDPPPVVPL